MSIAIAADAVALTAALIRHPTAGGDEEPVARELAARLATAGCKARVIRLTAGRSGLVARAGSDQLPALCLSGHLDTVPVDESSWTVDPFAAEQSEGRMYGRGASDMKSGVAAMVMAFEGHLASRSSTPVVLALSCAEETGCVGAPSMLPSIGAVGALVVGEPTSSRPRLGHRGALWVTARATGRSAHGSDPSAGDNAIDRMAAYLAHVRAAHAAGRLSGVATVSVATINGGGAVNVVPDSCAAAIDLRLTGEHPPHTVVAALEELASDVGSVNVVADLALPAVGADRVHPWVSAMVAEQGETGPAGYFTDAAVLAPGLGDPPVVLLGPGDASEAHTPDESCQVSAIADAVELYRVSIDLFGRS